MSTDAILLLVLLGCTIVLYVTHVVRIEVTSIAVIVALALTGILEPAAALSGFSSPATITVAAMLVLSAGLERAGVVDYVARLLSRKTGSDLTRLLVVLSIPTMGFSAFINNTPVVALMIPVAITLARKAKIAPSRVLLPVSYFSILAGTCTLFGTSTNILVDALYREAGGAGFGVFEFTPLGLVYLGFGAAYVVLLAPRILPNRAGFSDLLTVEGPGRFISEVVLKSGSRYVGKPLAQAFPPDSDVHTLQVIRDEEAILRPAAEFVLREDDVLYVESTARTLHHLHRDPELATGTAVADEERVPLHALLAGDFPTDRSAWGLDAEPMHEQIGPVDLRLAEAVVVPNSQFIGQPVRALRLSRKYGVQVLALRRLGRQHQYRLRDLRLQAGDVLLIQGQPMALRTVQEEGDILLVEGVESTLTFPERAPAAVAIMGGVVLLASLGVAPIVFLALAGTALMLLLRCIDVRAAVRSLEPEVLMLLAGTIPLGIAIEKVGLASATARELVAFVGADHPWIMVAALYVFTSILTEILSNNAAAVLLVPIAMGIAQQAGIDPKPLLIAVAFGASASFATPIGYQTNTLVMGPGGYRFTDYLKFGIPLNLLMAIVASLLIPVFWRT